MWNVFKAERTVCANVIGDTAVSGQRAEKSGEWGREGKSLPPGPEKISRGVEFVTKKRRLKLQTGIWISATVREWELLGGLHAVNDMIRLHLKKSFSFSGGELAVGGPE